MKPLFPTQMKLITNVSWQTKPSALFLLFTALMLASPFATPVEGAKILAQKVVAEVNQARITETALMAEVRSYLRKIGHQELSSVRMAAVKKNALKKLIEEELLYQEGLKLLHEEAGSDLMIAEVEIESGILQIQNRFPSAQAYKASLSEEGLTEEAVRLGIERALIIRKTWAFFSTMDSKVRIAQLKTLTQRAAIQIYAHPVAIREEKHSIAAQQ